MSLPPASRIMIGGAEYTRSSASAPTSPPEKGSMNPAPVEITPHTCQLRSVPKTSLGTALASVHPSMRRALLRAAGFTGGPKDIGSIKVRLPLTPQAVSSNGAGQVQVVYGVQYSGLVQGSDWTTVFKEYRFTSAELFFIPSGVPVLSAADAAFGAGINYSSNITAPGSIAEVCALDQGQIIGLGETKRSRWHCDFEKMFGEIWTDTGTSVAFATWKAFNTATGNPLSVQLGNWFGYVDVEFRGLG